MRAPVVSRKHIVQHTQTTISSATKTTFVDVSAVQIQNVDANFEVVEGSVIKAIYVELWLLGVGTTQSTFVVIVEKSQSGQADPTFTQMTTLDAYSNKKNVLYSSQGLIGASDTNPTPVLRQWLKIPKSKQRFGLDDRFRISIASLGAQDVVACGLTIFKSYT